MESKILIDLLEFDLVEIQKDHQATLVMLKNNYEKVIKHIQVIEKMLDQNKENVENSILLNTLYRKYREQKKLVHRLIADTTKISSNHIKTKPYNFCDIDKRHVIMDPNNNESDGLMLRPRPTKPPKKYIKEGQPEEK